MFCQGVNLENIIFSLTPLRWASRVFLRRSYANVRQVTEADEFSVTIASYEGKSNLSGGSAS